jgi:hypothetical protein
MSEVSEKTEGTQEELQILSSSKKVGDINKARKIWNYLNQ